MSLMTQEIQVQKIIDTQAIERLLFTYAFHLDMNQTKELAALFT